MFYLGEGANEGMGLEDEVVEIHPGLTALYFTRFEIGVLYCL